MLPTDALKNLATYAGQVTGLKAHYPAPGTIAAPCVVLFWDEAEISEMSEQYWLMTVKGQLLVSRKGNTGGEIVTADALIAPLVDAFSNNNANRNPYHLKSFTGPDQVDRCRVERVQSSLGINYAGHEYYGAEVWWGIKLRRFTGDT